MTPITVYDNQSAASLVALKKQQRRHHDALVCDTLARAAGGNGLDRAGPWVLSDSLLYAASAAACVQDSSYKIRRNDSEPKMPKALQGNGRSC